MHIAMTNPKKALILIGSPKRALSTSDFIANYFVEALKKNGVISHKQNISTLFLDESTKNRFFTQIDTYDLIFFSCPLYLDGPPYPVIKAMELIKKHRNDFGKQNKQKFYVISNGGYPEASHNDTAMLIYRQFAEESGFEWMGGLEVGMGAFANVRFFKNINFFFKRIQKQALDIVYRIVNSRRNYDEKTTEKADPFIPIWLYFLGTRIAARVMAAQNFVWRIYKDPYRYKIFIF